MNNFYSNFLTEEISNNLPTVRIKKAKIENFKSVKYGEIVFNCGREFVPYGTESDILGIYGQNGSGKTSFIEALSILQLLMSGNQVPSVYADCIDIDTDNSRLEFVFDLQYEDGKIREVTYSFFLKRINLNKDELYLKYKESESNSESSDDFKLEVYNEMISMKWEDSYKNQVIIDTSSNDVPFIPDTKRKIIAGNDKKDLYSLEVNKLLAREKSQSFIFSDDTLKVFMNHDSSSIFFKVLVELKLYALDFLYVIDTKSSGHIRLNSILPIDSVIGRMVFHMNKPETIPTSIVKYVNDIIDDISSVLGQLVPGLSIKLKELSDSLDKDGNPTKVLMLLANRDGKELPLRDESDGVRKIISVLNLLINVFNQKSTTVAIDEFDAGIFEYLLGEILETLQEFGKGQFIFTSHNLRPLEVIDKKFIYFTTTNENNRFIRLKNIGATNNLRDTFFREILLCEQDEKIYNNTKRFKIVESIRRAKAFNDGK